MEHAIHQQCPDCFLDPDLEVLREHTDRLNGVTQHLLGLARDDGESQQVVVLGDLLPKVVKLLEQTFASRGLSLRQNIEDDLPPVSIGEAAIETVCMNLLLNAADATPAGGVVTIEARRSTNTGVVELEVSDTGPGIPEELRHKIFEPFFTTKTEQRGTGLGLAVCRSIVERQHGTIQVGESRRSGGLFTVTLPTASSS
jgi:signal transduction histidine kinase